MSPLPRQGWLFLIEFLKWYFSKYWQVRTRPVFAQTVTYCTLGQAKLIYSLSSGLFLKCMRAGGHFSFFIISFGPAHVATETNNLMSQPNTEHLLIIFRYRYHGPCKETVSCNLLYSIS